jgi:P27 family predicted phage terminase small subunit
MARGRPPKPREQRIAEGMAGHRPLPEPVLGLGKVLTFDPPADLRPAEAEAWQLIVPEIAALGWIDRFDGHWIRQLVAAVAVANELRDEIASNGVMIDTYDKDGIVRGVQLNPAVNALARQQQTIRQYLEQLGGSPSARAKLGLVKVKGAEAALALADRLRDDEPGDDDVIEVPDDAVTESP